MSNIILNIIVAVDAKWGIGRNGTIPWQEGTRSQEAQFDTRFFIRKTQQVRAICIMGRKTWESLPGRRLSNRACLVLTSDSTLKDIPAQDVFFARTFADAIKWAQEQVDGGKQYVYAIGGVKVYEEALRHPLLRKVFVTHIPGDFACDTFFPREFLNQNRGKIINPIVRRYEMPTANEENYLDLLCRLALAPVKPNRTGVSAHALFGESLRFDLWDESRRCAILPLLTTKHIEFEQLFHELKWFLSGATNTKYLVDNGVKVWNANTTREFLDSHGLISYPEGEVGAGYAWQWRNFDGEYMPGGENKVVFGGKGDQIARVLKSLREDPYGRRHVVSAWNPLQLNQTALPPCHMEFQFDVGADGRLNCEMKMRSADVFLGVPWNIAEYALLTHIFAAAIGRTPGELMINMCDCHLYTNHVYGALLQTSRKPWRFPEIAMDVVAIKKLCETRDISEIELGMIKICDYFAWSAIKAEMAV